MLWLFVNLCIFNDYSQKKVLFLKWHFVYCVILRLKENHHGFQNSRFQRCERWESYTTESKYLIIMFKVNTMHLKFWFQYLNWWLFLTFTYIISLNNLPFVTVEITVTFHVFLIFWFSITSKHDCLSNNVSNEVILFCYYLISELR